MDGSFDRRHDPRNRVQLTALVRRGRRKNPVILRVANLGHGGARCRSTHPFRLGAAFHAEFFVEGKGADGPPRTLNAYCRVVWTAVLEGPTGSVQEMGLEFEELDSSQRRLLTALLQDVEAA